MKKGHVTVQIGEELQIQLKEVARLQHRSESDVVHEALQIYLQEVSGKQNCYDLAKRLGIVGIASDLPEDLSTNPDYFNGFGGERSSSA